MNQTPKEIYNPVIFKFAIRYTFGSVETNIFLHIQLSCNFIHFVISLIWKYKFEIGLWNSSLKRI